MNSSIHVAALAGTLLLSAMASCGGKVNPDGPDGDAGSSETTSSRPPSSKSSKSAGWGGRNDDPRPFVVTDEDDDSSDVPKKDGGAAATVPTGVGLVIMASGQASPYGITLDASNVYWTNCASDGSVMRMSKTGGKPVALVTSQANPRPVAVDATWLYWGNGTMIARQPLAGGAIEYLDFNGASDFASDADYLYTTTNLTDGITRISKASGTPKVLAAGLVAPLGAITVHETTVYWTASADTGKVMSSPIGGGVLRTLATSESIPMGIATDGTNVYWVNHDGAVRTMPNAGGEIRTLASKQGGPLGLVLDGTVLYWTNFDSGSVMKLDVATAGPPKAIATGLDKPAKIVVDGTSVYWTELGGGRIMKAPK
ncbi:MAG TPA: hypothetical protein VM925_25255 [Labilithrix sp.]|nr:hypothetical protein [Labilithrix sp.]